MKPRSEDPPRTRPGDRQREGEASPGRPRGSPERSDPVPAIEARGLGRAFGDLWAVRELDLSVRTGEIFGFLGQNGAGKTTTIRMLCGLLRPTEGTLRVEGNDPRIQPDAVRRAIGFVPDAPPLYDYLTGRQHIGFVASLYGVPSDLRDERASSLLETLDLEGRADDLCKGYSHGMRKKIHLAAVLVTSPRVLLLDEPTSGLDPRSARRLKDLLLKARAGGSTVFLSTHLLDTAEELCDRVGILSEGRLQAEGSLDELRVLRGERSLEAIFLALTDQGIAGSGETGR